MTICYKGMTAAQTDHAYNVMDSIPDAMDWLKKNKERAKTEDAKLNPLKDISYGNDEIQKLDIYLPEKPTRAPVVIDIHGGGWYLGSKSPRAIPAATMLAHGTIWVAIDYGLAPAYRIDQIIAHVRQAIAWIHHNISQYGGDPNRLFIHGHSAGGHLAATALMPDWHDKYAIPKAAIRAVVAVSGVYDLDSQMYADNASQKALSLSQEASRQASPLHHLPNHKIPIILSYGEIEPLGYSMEAKEYAKVLKEAGCSVDIIEVPGANHFDMMNELNSTQGRLFQAVTHLLKTS